MFLGVNLNNFDPISPNSVDKIFNTASLVEITVVIAVVILGNTIGSDFTDVDTLDVDTLVNVELAVEILVVEVDVLGINCVLIVVSIEVDDKCCVELREL